jgi:hypothetical protein
MPSVHGTNMAVRQIPNLDAATIALSAQAITTAGNYDGSFIDLGPNYAGGMDLVFIPTSTLAGGTSLQFILLADADGVAGSEYAEMTSKAYSTATLPDVYRIAIPAGLRYVKPRVTSLGTYTAGTVTAGLATRK